MKNEMLKLSLAERETVNLRTDALSNLVETENNETAVQQDDIES